MSLPISILASAFGLFLLNSVIPQYIPDDLDPEVLAPCTPGSIWEFDHRVCTCPPSGIGGAPDTCSRKPADDLSEDHCKPGSMWMVNDKPCLCPASGNTEEAVCYKTTSAPPIWPFDK